VVVLHALTGDSHVASHTADDRPGWWEAIVGAGKAINTERYHVLASNVLGGAMGSTGPSSVDSHGRIWGSRFPRLTLEDRIAALHDLIAALNLGSVILIGGSMGAMMALAYARAYPAETLGVMAIGSPMSHGPWAIAYHTVARQAILNDPEFRGGDYYEGPGPRQGMTLARMADMISYQSPEAMQRKFGRERRADDTQEFQVASYLKHHGAKLVERFDANTYLGLTEALDQADLREQDWTPAQHVPMSLVGIRSDQLYLPEEIYDDALWLQQQGLRVKYEELLGSYGHDSFLVEPKAMATLVETFLDALS
jgi:homoserine O-acetyltransferase